MEPKKGELIFGRFKFISSLGAGGMGKVYKCTDTLLNRIVAIKMLLSNASDQVIKRFHMEAKALAALDHPNILKVYDFVQDDSGQLYLVMDYLHGKSLTSHLEKKGFYSFDESIWIIIQICNGLIHAHEQKILHRDIKPSNVMILDDGPMERRVKLVDFGIAKLNMKDQSMTQKGACIGSPPYMSPEAVKGILEVDERADIYSLGCMIFEMLAGVPPFMQTTGFQIMMSQMKKEPPKLAERCNRDFEPEVEALVAKCIKKDPAERFASVKDLQREVLRTLQVIHERANTPPPPIVPAIPLSERLRKLRWVVASLILVIVGTITVVIVSKAIRKESQAQGEKEQAAFKPALEAAQEPTEQIVRTAGAYEQNPFRYQPEKNAAGGPPMCVVFGARDEDVKTAVKGCPAKSYSFKRPNQSFTGKGLADLPKEELVELRLENCVIGKEGVEQIALMKNLNLLSFMRCKGLTGDSIKSISNLKNLCLLELQADQATDGSLAPLASLPKLFALRIEDGPISERTMNDIAKIPKLRWLTLIRCTVPESAYAVLANKTKLPALSVQSMDISPAAMDEIAKLPLIQINLDGSRLTDETAMKLTKVKTFMTINVFHTGLQPETIAALKKINPGIQVNADDAATPANY